MFDFDPNTIEIAKLFGMYFLGILTAIAGAVFAVISYELKHPEGGKHLVDPTTVDSKHIDFALNQN